MKKKSLKVGLLLSTALLIANCSNDLPVALKDSAKDSPETAVLSPTSDYPSAILKHVAVLDLNLKMMLFSLHEDKKIRVKYQTSIGIEKSTWPSGFTDLGAPSGHTLTSDLAATHFDANLWVFSLTTASTSGKRIYYRKRTNGSSAFDPWTRLEIAGGYGGLEIITEDNNLAVFTTNSSGKLLYIKIPSSGTPTSQQLGDLVVKKFTVIKRVDGYLEVVATSQSSGISVHRIYQTSSSTWNTWSSIGSPSSSIDVEADIKGVLNMQNDIIVFVNTTDRRIYSRTHLSSGGWTSGWSQVGDIADAYKRFDVKTNPNGRLDLIYINVLNPNPPGNIRPYWRYQLSGETTWRRPYYIFNNQQYDNPEFEFGFIPSIRRDTQFYSNGDPISIFYHAYTGRNIVFFGSYYDNRQPDATVPDDVHYFEFIRSIDITETDHFGWNYLETIN